MTVPKRPPGRPPLDPRDPSVHVSVTLPTKQFDALCAQAHRHGVSVPEVIRRLLTHATPDKNLKT